MTEEKHMSPEYEAAKQVVDAAIVVLDIEAHWTGGRSAEWGQPYQTKIRELKAAADRYLDLRKGSM